MTAEWGSALAGFAPIVEPVGYSAGFGLTAAVLLMALLPAWRDSRVRRRAG